VSWMRGLVEVKCVSGFWMKLLCNFVFRVGDKDV
jgi:hypothetical protein